jgi:hypothetical protein
MGVGWLRSPRLEAGARLPLTDKWAACDAQRPLLGEPKGIGPRTACVAKKKSRAEGDHDAASLPLRRDNAAVFSQVQKFPTKSGGPPWDRIGSPVTSFTNLTRGRQHYPRCKLMVAPCTSACASCDLIVTDCLSPRVTKLRLAVNVGPLATT